MIFSFSRMSSNGCPMRIFDASATVVWEAQFGGWGDVTRKTTERVYNPLRLQGQYYDEESRLSYNRFRYYDAGIGQFVSQDPLGITIHPNPYHYAPNIHGWIDPLGLKCFELPAWKKVLVDWAHIEERHVAGGALTGGRTIFSGLSLDGVKAALRRALEKVEVQGERLLVRGFDEKSGYVIDAWYNKVTKTIETAFPPATHL